MVVWDALINEIGPNPTCGLPIKSFAGRVRKLRLPNPDRKTGKSGGFRLIYDWNPDPKSRVPWLLAIFSKTEMADLADKEIERARKEVPI